MKAVINRPLENSTKPIILKYDKNENNLTKDEFTGKQIYKDVEIWSWLKDRTMSRIDFDKLRSIKINKGEFYTDIQIKNIELEK